MTPQAKLQIRRSTQEAQPLDFASIVWYDAEIDLLVAHLNEQLGKLLKSYPEPYADTIRKMIASRQQLKEEEVIVTNGPLDAYHLIARAFPKSKVLLPTPCHKSIDDACRLYQCQVNYIDNASHIEEWPLENVDICFLTTPNAPDGHMHTYADFERAFKKHPNVMFVLNQSYATFTTTNKLKPSHCKQFPNIITLWSFSQPYGIPGLRIGYIAAPTHFAEAIWQVHTPMIVTSGAIEAAKYILIHPAQFALPIRKWLRNARELMNALRQLDYLEVFPSDTTFFMFRPTKGNSKELLDYLREKQQILLGDGSQFVGVPEGCLTITARSEEENKRLLEALDEWHREESLA